MGHILIRTGFCLSIFVAISAVISWIGHVDQTPSASDIRITRRYFGNTIKSEVFKDQVALIASVQKRVLELSPETRPIPNGHPREIQDLVLAHGGWCYDRSRSIEQMLRVLGFEVRHANLYQTDGKNGLVALFTPLDPSHAVVDVKTSRGWLMVDSAAQWLPIDSHGEPLSAQELSQGTPLRVQEPAGPTKSFLSKGFVAVYGLYSRHGRFFPPYGPVPNFDIMQVLRFDLV